MSEMRQDEFKIEIVGNVDVPDLDSLLARIATAARFKQLVTLTPGEARILTDHLEENQ